MQGKISVLNVWQRDWLPYFNSMFDSMFSSMFMLLTSLHTGLVPASEELRKLQEEGNLDDDGGEEDEPSDDEHYESVDGENGVNEVD